MTDLVETTAITSARWTQVWGTRPLLVRVARRHGADSDDAEDIAQEAILKAAEHPEITEDRLQSWLVAVTIRLSMDGHRRRARETRRWQRASARAVIPSSGQDPENEVCERFEAVWVASLAAEILPPRQVQALQLTAAGCDVQQVASQLGVRYRAAESLLARARRTVRSAIAGSLGVLVWAWRGHMPAAAHPIPIALASATAVTMMVVAMPGVLPSPEHGGELPGYPPAAARVVPGPTGGGAAADASVPARPNTPGGQADRLTPQPPRDPLPAPAVVQVPAPLDAVGPLTAPSLPELPAVPPLVAPDPPLLGRSGPVTPQPLPELPALPGGVEDVDEGLLPDVGLPAALPSEVDPPAGGPAHTRHGDRPNGGCQQAGVDLHDDADPLTDCAVNAGTADPAMVYGPTP